MNINELLETGSYVSKKITGMINLDILYNNSQPLQHVVEITDLLHRSACITDKREAEHLKVDLRCYVDSYKEEFEKIGINISEYLDFRVK